MDVEEHFQSISSCIFGGNIEEIFPPRVEISWPWFDVWKNAQRRFLENTAMAIALLEI